MNIKINDIVDVTVTGIEPYGAFVMFADGKKGLLHISEVSYDYVSDIKDYITLNTIITVKVMDVLSDGKIRVSLKALQKQSNRRSRRLKSNPTLDFKIGFQSLEVQRDLWFKQLEEEYND